MCWAVATAENVEAKPDSFCAGFILHQLKSPSGFLGSFPEGCAGEFTWKMPDPPKRHFLPFSSFLLR